MERTHTAIQTGKLVALLLVLALTGCVPRQQFNNPYDQLAPTVDNATLIAPPPPMISNGSVQDTPSPDVSTVQDNSWWGKIRNLPVIKQTLDLLSLPVNSFFGVNGWWYVGAIALILLLVFYAPRWAGVVIVLALLVYIIKTVLMK